MGGSQTGLVGTIGIALLNSDGTVHTARATAGIYEIGGGCYGKNISFSDNWKGIIEWDTGGGSPVYAVEEYTIDGLADTILEDTNELQTNQGNWLTATGFNVVVPDPAGTAPTVGKIRTEMEGVGTKLTGVKDKTDNLPASPAPASEYDMEMGRIDVVLSTRSSHGDPTSGIKGAPGKTNQEIFDNECGTDGAYTGTPPTVDQIATAIFDKVVEGTLTFEQLQKIVKAFIGGKTSGGGTTGIKFRDSADSKDRIAMTVDNNGNRSAVTLDGS